MKRDMDLVRLILLELEKAAAGQSVSEPVIEGYDRETIADHCSILNDHELTSGYNVFWAGNEIYSFSAGRLTWKGHEFIEAVRDQSKWGRIKQYAKDNGKELVLSTIIPLALGGISSK